MTQVKVRRVPINHCLNSEMCDELQLFVEGHAGYGVKGKDTICSAESILVQCYAAFLAGLAQDYLFDFSVDGMDKGGSVAISAIPTRKGWQYISGAFQCVAMGFFLLAKHYPKHVNIRLNEPTQEG